MGEPDDSYLPNGLGIGPVNSLSQREGEKKIKFSTPVAAGRRRPRLEAPLRSASRLLLTSFRTARKDGEAERLPAQARIEEVTQERKRGAAKELGLLVNKQPA